MQQNMFEEIVDYWLSNYPLQNLNLIAIKFSYFIATSSVTSIAIIRYARTSLQSAVSQSTRFPSEMLLAGDDRFA
jgi:hypothetical protein